MPSTNFRIAAIDVLRALTMLLMIFVNDLWLLTGIPEWLEHTAAEADGMGLADVVFPAFLFLVGMSIPLSIKQRQAKGDNKGKILLHIIERSVALLIMGLFLVNGEYINEAATGIQRGSWNVVCCSCFILLWNNWPSSLHKGIVYSLKTIALLVLFYLAWIYRGGEEGQWQTFGTHWWGILGLIGWAYLASAVIFLFADGKLLICILAWIIFAALNIASHAGRLPGNELLHTIISPIGEGAMTAFTMGGAVITLLLLHFRKRNETSKDVHHICIDRNCFICIWHLPARVLGHFKDQGHTRMGADLQRDHDRMLYAVVLADGSQRKEGLVQYHQTCGNEYTALLSAAVFCLHHHVVIACSFTGGSIDRRDWLVAVFSFFAGDDPDCGMVGKSWIEVKIINVGIIIAAFPTKP